MLVEEANQAETANEVYTVKLVKTNRGDRHRSPEWAAVLKPTISRDGDIIVIPDFATYNGEPGRYYPNMQCRGSMNKGSDVTSNKSAPFISASVVEMLNELAAGDYYSENTHPEFNDIKGTSLAEIKRQLS